MADISVTAASVLKAAGAVVDNVVAGETITAGQPVYEDTSDSNQWKLSDASAAGTAGADGISLNGASDGQPLAVQKGGNITFNAVLTSGETYVVSAASGKIAPITDLVSTNVTSILGTATSTTNLTMALHSTSAARAADVT